MNSQPYPEQARPPNIRMEPTRQTVCAIMSPSRAAHSARYTDSIRRNSDHSSSGLLRLLDVHRGGSLLRTASVGRGHRARLAFRSRARQRAKKKSNWLLRPSGLPGSCRRAVRRNQVSRSAARARVLVNSAGSRIDPPPEAKPSPGVAPRAWATIDVLARIIREGADFGSCAA